MATKKGSKSTVSRTASAPKTVVKAPTAKPATPAKVVTKTRAPAKSAPRQEAPPKAARAPRKRVAKSLVSAEQRRNYVEIAAYYIAERRGFAPGDPLQDWIAAEAEIDRLLAGGLLGN